MTRRRKLYKDYFQPETNEGELDHLLRSGSALPPSAGSALTREQWLGRCIDRFQRKAGLSPKIARQCAEAQLEADKDDPTERTPEDAADDEMSYWTD